MPTLRNWRHGVRPEDIHDLDDTKSRYIVKTEDKDGNFIGLVEVHSNKMHPEKECAGSVPFEGQKWAEPGRSWKVEGTWPNLTLTPSIQCRACGEHGWIRDGKWVSA